MNILLKHDNVGKVKKISVDFNAGENSAVFKEGIIYINFDSPEKMQIIDVLIMLRDNLGWDFAEAVEAIKLFSPVFIVG